MKSEIPSAPSKQPASKYLAAGLVTLLLAAVALAGYRHWIARPPLIVVGDLNAGVKRAWQPATVQIALRNDSWLPLAVERIDKY